VRGVVKGAHSDHGRDDSEENHDPNDPTPLSIPRHPFVDDLVLVYRRRFFFKVVAHGNRAVVNGSSALLRCCVVGRGGRCAAIAAFL
jgi:hypothetical protein